MPADFGFTDIGRVITKKWHTLSAEEKQPFVVLGDSDKKRYRQQLTEYQQQLQSCAANELPASLKRKVPKVRAAQPKPPRGAFDSYAVFRWPKLREDNPGTTAIPSI